jgi:hypothetical protein
MTLKTLTVTGIACEEFQLLDGTGIACEEFQLPSEDGFEMTFSHLGKHTRSPWQGSEQRWLRVIRLIPFCMQITPRDGIDCSNNNTSTTTCQLSEIPVNCLRTSTNEFYFIFKLILYSYN